jgi:hypothetical protein
MKSFPGWSLSSITMVFLLLQGCATLDPDYEKPTVVLSSFKPLPSEGGIPSFEVGLKIINPNKTDLNLEGIVYTISVQGREIVKGVGKDFPVIESYSEGSVNLTATPNLLAGIRLITDMLGEPAKSLNYEFEAKLDMGGLLPSLRISETGEFRMDGSSPSSREAPQSET